MKLIVPYLGVLLLLFACTPKNHTKVKPEHGSFDYFALTQQRAKLFQSAAYLIDLRINDAGTKYSITTEVYVSGDSTAFYGRGYVGKGAFKGHVVNDVATIYFRSENEYYSGPLGNLGNGAECSSPGEVLLYVLSLLSSSNSIDKSNPPVGLKTKKNAIEYLDGRFDHTIRLEDGLFPKKEILVDKTCRDSIVINYMDAGRSFPFYKVEDALYYSGLYDFRARGFVREQQYNIDIKQSKFELDIPSSATLLDRI
ncbi:MAG: hypothetical protein R3F48_12235 [Candidatus Zixiibacteriota bacterium]